MRTVAIIPARGGSRGVPGKNLRPIGGVPLVARAVRACRAAKRIDHIFVSTDDAAIAAAARDAGAEVIDRPTELATDTATSESALLHGLDVMAGRGIDTDILVFVQCTSPFIRPQDLDAAVSLVASGSADSAFSGIETYEFLWRDADPGSIPGTGAMRGQNHDAGVRPRRQDRRPDYRETGAFYAMSAGGFREARHRFFGTTRVVPVSELASLEIDTAEELALADAFAGVIDSPDSPAPPGDPTDQAIRAHAVITDFDGVHTPDTAYIDQNGQEMVRVSRSDGLGISVLRRAGIPFLICSREVNPVVAARAHKLGVSVVQAVADKRTAILTWLDEAGIDPAEAAYVGNDINDLGPLCAVGWPIAVADAHPEVKRIARVVLSQRGGEGAVRELCDRVAAAHESARMIVNQISDSRS